MQTRRQFVMSTSAAIGQKTTVSVSAPRLAIVAGMSQPMPFRPFERSNTMKGEIHSTAKRTT